MTESKEREAYRMKCRYYLQTSGMCLRRSNVSHFDDCMLSVARICAPDCGCARMKRWDKKHKEK